MADISLNSSTHPSSVPGASLGGPSPVTWKDQIEETGETERDALLPGVKPTASSSSKAPTLEFGPMAESNPAAPLDFSKPPKTSDMTRRPDDLQAIPDRFDLWPDHPLKIACPMCGFFTTTTLEQETECVGFLSLFTDGPLFKDTATHYCPRCRGRVGVHYTGGQCGRGMGCCKV